MMVTVPQRYSQYSQDSVLFISIDSVEMVNIDGLKLAKQTRSLYRLSGVLTPGFGFLAGNIVIEKIGDLGFFLPIKDIECDAICPYELRCYQDDSIFYKAVDMPCDSITPLESSNFPVLDSENVVLYPNPVQSESGRIQVEGVQVENWILRDLQGRVLYEQSRKLGGQSVDIPVDLQAGMYFLDLRSEGKRYVKRLVVQ